MEKGLPKNWIEVQLIDILEILQNGSRPKGGVQGILEGVPSLGGEHLDNNGGFKFGNLKYVPTSFAEKMNRGLIKENDILIVKDGATTGKTSFVNNEFPYDLAFVNEHVFICRTHSHINPKAIFYFLFSKKGFDRIMDNFTGSAQGGINQKFASNTVVPLPPLAEQHRIVAKLDTLFTQLETIKTSMAKVPVLLKNFRQQVLTQAVTGKLTEEWRKGKELERVTLSDTNNKIDLYESIISEIIPDSWKILKLETVSSKITDGEHQTPKRIETGKMLLSAKNVRDGFVSYSDFDCISDEDFEKCLKRCKAEVGDVLIVSVGATIGRTAIVIDDKEFALVRSVALIKPSDLILGKFLMFVLQSKYLQNVIEKVSRGSAQACLYINKIAGLPFPYTCITEQQEIVSHVESLFAKADAIEKQYENLKAQIDTLPQAILNKAFKGELTEQLDSDGDAKDLLEEIMALKATTGKLVKSKTNKTAATKVSQIVNID